MMLNDDRQHMQMARSLLHRGVPAHELTPTLVLSLLQVRSWLADLVRML